MRRTTDTVIFSSRETNKKRRQAAALQNMSDTITVYEKPTCTKCREMDRFLRESAVDFAKLNYYLEPLSEKKLRELIKKMGINPRKLLRTSEPIYRELELGKKELSDDAIIAL